MVVLDKQLRDLLRANPLKAQDAEALRLRLMDAATHLADAHPAFAASKEVEQALWKPCVYRRIEDFRRRIRKYAVAAQTDRNVREHFARVSSEFQQFLNESAAFYAHLRDRYESWLQLKRLSVLQDDSDAITCCRKSLHRCYVFLGDLARYRELHSQKAKKNFAAAEALYNRALTVLPENGNPHNQLAVLATYVEAETVAVYRYCRSLLTSQPFTTAEENLALLFERSRQRPLAAPTILTSSQISSKEKSALLKSFLHRLTRMHGILFALSSSHDSLSTSKGRCSDEVMPIYPRDMETVLFKDMQMLLQAGIIGDALLLKIVVTNIFCIIRASKSRPLLEDALRLSIRMVTSVMEFLVNIFDMKSKDSAISEFRLAGPVAVFCDYLKLHSDLQELTEKLSASRQRKLYSDVITSEQGTSGDHFVLAFLNMLAKLVNHVRIRELHASLTLGNGQQSGDGVIDRQYLLKESIELRGFAPLEQTVSKLTRQDDWEPQSSVKGAKNASSAAPLSDMEAAKIRALKLYRFARYLCEYNGGNSLMFCDESGNFTTFADKSNTQQNNSVQEAVPPVKYGSFPIGNSKQPQRTEELFNKDFRAGTGVDEDDDFEDEVIVYQPSLARREMMESQTKQYGESMSSALESFSGGSAFSLREPSSISPADEQDRAKFNHISAFGAGSSFFGASPGCAGLNTYNDGDSFLSQSMLSGWKSSGESVGFSNLNGFTSLDTGLSMSTSGQDTNFLMPFSAFGGDLNGKKSLFPSSYRSDEKFSFTSMADLAAVERESALYQQRASSLSAFLGTSTPLTQTETQDSATSQAPTRPPPGFGDSLIGTKQQQQHMPKSFINP
ncbi:Nonsense-mediated mRNA decay protein [Plasmopara halstedii]|uniref:Nonsense-mediated mRNA decay protein n=1 Tax=Plasmopara halstedii TaxID=4781 RepID=A0A0P1A647_PLAHL|nr:Nonsense-mediated mRNA decay protein [Plasmopara halstedii]CEG35817.1 Nonsense-mediated mRNA decay protein [Plasmopara halstedii]|eukprot:XP_024572186.1 Nonsense-mediated mRNA decay protein [Plasmopara halstedii]